MGSRCGSILHIDDVGDNYLRAKVLRMKILFERSPRFRGDGVPEIRRQAEILGQTEDALVQELGEHAVVLRDHPFAERADEGFDAPVPRHHDMRLRLFRNDGERERRPRTIADTFLKVDVAPKILFQVFFGRGRKDRRHRDIDPMGNDPPNIGHLSHGVRPPQRFPDEIAVRAKQNVQDPKIRLAILVGGKNTAAFHNAPVRIQTRSHVELVLDFEPEGAAMKGQHLFFVVGNERASFNRTEDFRVVSRAETLEGRCFPNGYGLDLMVEFRNGAENLSLGSDDLSVSRDQGQRAPHLLGMAVDGRFLASRTEAVCPDAACRPGGKRRTFHKVFVEPIKFHGFSVFIRERNHQLRRTIQFQQEAFLS